MSLGAKLRMLWSLGQGLRGLAEGIPDSAADRGPINLFQDWFENATKSGILMPEAMTLATSTADGTPSARMVLLKSADEHGFVFFTNYSSRKSRELGENPRAALVFHWAMLQRQVRVEGPTHRVTEEESYAYYKTRLRGSRIGAWASRQSEVLASPEELREQVRKIERRFKGLDVPLPPFWGGYRLVPERVEFWQGRANRLHDRLEFARAGNGWTTSRLYP